MSRPLLACALLALSLRLGLAVVTEFKPIFPPYYYTDAEIVDQYAWNMAQGLREHKPYVLPGSPSQRVQTAILGNVYAAAGHKPILGKILSAALAALLIVVFYRCVEPLFGPGPAGASALLVALWPSHVFFTSQNFKDIWVMLPAYAAIAAALAAMARPHWSKAAAVLVFLLALGLFRTYLMITLSAVLALGFLVELLKSRKKPALALGLAAAIAAPLAYAPLSRWIFSADGPLGTPAEISDPKMALKLLPPSYDYKTKKSLSPFSPEGISQMRFIRQMSDGHWARREKQRQIGSQLFVGLTLDSWLDLLLFLPLGAFYVLFMPLPLLYPLGANLGRIFSSLENVILLGLAVSAAIGAWRGPKTAARGVLLGFFLAMAAGSALLEFDLGSAARHKLLYMPLLFPFALSRFWPKAK